MKRNNSIDFYRYFFTAAVFFLHFSSACYPDIKLFKGGYLGVDFFFIVSGVFLAQKSNKEPLHAIEYTKRKIISLFPLYFFSIITILLYNCLGVISDFGLTFKTGYEIWLVIIKEVNEALMIQMNGIETQCINFPLWYVSILVFGGYIVYYLYSNYRKIFVELYAPLLILVGYSLVYRYGDGNLDYNISYIYIFQSGMIRGLAGLCIGVLIYTYRSQMTLLLSRIRKTWLAIFEIFSIIAILTCIFIKPHTEFDFLMPIYLFILVVLSYMECPVSKFFGFIGAGMNKMFGTMMTFSLYANSKLVQNIFVKYWMYKSDIVLTYFLYTVFLFIFSYIVMKIINKLTFIWKKLFWKNVLFNI